MTVFVSPDRVYLQLSSILHPLISLLQPPIYLETFTFAKDVAFAYTEKEDTKQSIASQMLPHRKLLSLFRLCKG